MSVPKFIWKVWLRINVLIKDVDNHYYCEISTNNQTRRNEDIAHRILGSGSEYKYETLMGIIEEHDRVVRQMLQEGSSVLTGVCQYTPRVTGTFVGTSAVYNPQEHKLTLDITPSAEMREALKEVGIEILGVKDSAGSISLVTDAFTGLTTGVITPNEDIIIDCYRAKVAPVGENGIGVSLVGEDGTIYQVTHRLIQNDPSRIIARVPDLPSGTYTLRIVTRYSNSSTLLKEARIIEYEAKLTVA